MQYQSDPRWDSPIERATDQQTQSVERHAVDHTIHRQGPGAVDGTACRRNAPDFRRAATGDDESVEESAMESEAIVEGRADRGSGVRVDLTVGQTQSHRRGPRHAIHARKVASHPDAITVDRKTLRADNRRGFEQWIKCRQPGAG
ncbi:MAG: hypothetical protein IPK97_10030 [Ahniella sp.]|nr:hypothetical protein [Ahniella sp.]